MGFNPHRVDSSSINDIGTIVYSKGPLKNAIPCTGQVFSRTEYPELSNILGEATIADCDAHAYHIATAAGNLSMIGGNYQSVISKPFLASNGTNILIEVRQTKISDVTPNYITIAKSTTGSNWKFANALLNCGLFKYIYYLNGSFYIGTSRGIWSSIDGEVWSQIYGRNTTGLAYGGSKYLVIDGTTAGYTTTDWNSLTNVTLGGAYTDVIYFNSAFLGVHSNSTVVHRSTDAITWTATGTLAAASENVTAKFILVNSNLLVGHNTKTTNAYSHSSTGTAWTGSTLAGAAYNGELTSSVHDGSRYGFVFDINGTIGYSWSTAVSGASVSNVTFPNNGGSQTYGKPWIINLSTNIIYYRPGLDTYNSGLYVYDTVLNGSNFSSLTDSRFRFSLAARGNLMRCKSTGRHYALPWVNAEAGVSASTAKQNSLLLEDATGYMNNVPFTNQLNTTTVTAFICGAFYVSQLDEWHIIRTPTDGNPGADGRYSIYTGSGTFKENRHTFTPSYSGGGGPGTSIYMIITNKSISYWDGTTTHDMKLRLDYKGNFSTTASALTIDTSPRFSIDGDSYVCGVGFASTSYQVLTSVDGFTFENRNTNLPQFKDSTLATVTTDQAFIPFNISGQNYAINAGKVYSGIDSNNQYFDIHGAAGNKFNKTVYLRSGHSYQKYITVNSGVGVLFSSTSYSHLIVDNRYGLKFTDYYLPITSQYKMYEVYKLPSNKGYLLHTNHGQASNYNQLILYYTYDPTTHMRTPVLPNQDDLQPYIIATK